MCGDRRLRAGCQLGHDLAVVTGSRDARSQARWVASRRLRGSGAAQNSEMPGGTNGPPTGAPASAIARDRRSAAGPVAGGLAVVGPVSRDRPRDRSLGRFGSECQPPRAGFRMDVRNDLHKGLVHKRARRYPDLSTNIGSPLGSVEKPPDCGTELHSRQRRVATRGWVAAIAGSYWADLGRSAVSSPRPDPCAELRRA